MKTYMRYIAVVFAVAMIICSVASVSAAFPDVASDNKHATAIQTMTNLGILGGYEDGTFRPDNLVRRDEMAKIIYATYTTYTDAGEGTSIFPDVSEKSWARGYISWCSSMGIVGGYEDGTFRPEGNITYDEALKMVCAMLGYKDFSSDLWPVDVRTKGLIDLELGENLEDIAGDAALTRAQIVQLVLNAFDKPMYQAPKAEEEMNGVESMLTNMGLQVVNEKATLKENVWNVEIINAQIVGTEGYGFRDYERNIITTKTGDENKIILHFEYADGTSENKVFKLEELALEAYAGKTDELITLNIDIIAKKGAKNEYLSSELVGVRKNGISGSKADTDGVEYFVDSGNKYAKYGIKIEGINYYDERFWDLRRITFYEDFVLITNGHVNPGTTDVINEYKLSYAWGHYNRWKTNFTFGLTQGYHKVQNAIDVNGDGWYDYLQIEFAELYKVKSVTSKTVELEWLYKENQGRDIQVVPEFTVPGVTDADGNPIVIPALDTVFPIENFEAMGEIKEGMVVLGTQIGDTFSVISGVDESIGYVVKYDSSAKSYTLNTGKTISGSYTAWKVWYSHQFTYGDNITNDVVEKFEASMKPMVGLNSEREYNYARFLTIEDKIVYVEKVKLEDTIKVDAYNKAILLYVTEPTEPQVNELTKEYEVFYPAYLMINGRTQLVNLNKKFAIDKFSAEAVSENGSKFRATVKEEDGVSRIMNANILVTYTVDSDGYYTLNTIAEPLKNEKGEVMELVIAEGDNKLSVNKSTGLFTITCEDGTVYNKVKKNSSSVIYYPETKEESGSHEYMEFYLGDEIPTEFAEAEVQSNIFLTYDKEKDMYYIASLVLTEDFQDVANVKTDYTNDARLHLYALTAKEATVEGKDVFAAYTFKNLFTYETTEVVNKKVDFDKANDTDLNKVYAWDVEKKDYVEVTSALASYREEVIEDYLDDDQIIFTESFKEGAIIDETVKIIALVDAETAETKTLTYDELIDVIEDVKSFNDENETEVELTAKIGTYKDENKDECIAYIIIDWAEYDEELDALVIAGDVENAIAAK